MCEIPLLLSVSLQNWLIIILILNKDLVSNKAADALSRNPMDSSSSSDEDDITDESKTKSTSEELQLHVCVEQCVQQIPEDILVSIIEESQSFLVILMKPH